MTVAQLSAAIGLSAMIAGGGWGAHEYLEGRYALVSDTSSLAQQAMLTRIEMAALKKERGRVRDLCEQFVRIYKWVPPLCK